MHARGAVAAIPVEKSDCRDLQFATSLPELFGQSCSFEKAECRAGMQFDVISHNFHRRRIDWSADRRKSGICLWCHRGTEPRRPTLCGCTPFRSTIPPPKAKGKS